VLERVRAAPRAALSVGPKALIAGAAVAAIAILWITANATTAGLGLLALSAAGIAYFRPDLLAPCAALAVPFGENSDAYNIHVAPIEAVVVGGAAGYALTMVARRTIATQPAHWVFAALLVCIAGTLAGPADHSLQLHAVVFWTGLWFVFHSITTFLDRQRSKLVLGALGAAVLFEAALALYEYVDRWSERFSLLHGALVYPLPKGTLTHPNAVAQFLVFGVFCVLALAFAHGGRLRWYGYAVAAVGALGLLVTFSRASWISFVVGGAVYALERRARGRVLAGGAVVAAFGVVLTLVLGGAIGSRISSTFSAVTNGLSNFRIELAERAAHIAAEHPLTGTGYFYETGVYAGRSDVATHPHDLFLGIAVFFGIPAAVAFAALVVIALRAAWSQFRAALASNRLAPVGMLATIGALLVNGLFEYPFWSPALTALVVIVLGICCSTNTWSGSEQRAAPPAAH
jgi:hypothetical protein